MISAAAAATRVLMVTLVKEHGLQYLLVATIIAGLLQVLAGLFRLGDLMRFVSRSVITERAGDPNFHGPVAGVDRRSLDTYLMVAGGLVIIIYLALTAIALWLGMDELLTVGDMGELAVDASGLPAAGRALNPRHAADRAALLGGRRPWSACWSR